MLTVVRRQAAELFGMAHEVMNDALTSPKAQALRAQLPAAPANGVRVSPKVPIAIAGAAFIGGNDLTGRDVPPMSRNEKLGTAAAWGGLGTATLLATRFSRVNASRWAMVGFGVGGGLLGLGAARAGWALVSGDDPVDPAAKPRGNAAQIGLEAGRQGMHRSWQYGLAFGPAAFASLGIYVAARGKTNAGTWAAVTALSGAAAIAPAVGGFVLGASHGAIDGLGALAGRAVGGDSPAAPADSAPAHAPAHAPA